MAVPASSDSSANFITASARIFVYDARRCIALFFKLRNGLQELFF
ncbi:hypothetical protein HMPREF9086_3445 [Enterobacter hormaechei ATCC 49162]|nr:hypothetical protein HMPREF9086_3445 [Enterobacter hormaechei ATCC 49162]